MHTVRCESIVYKNIPSLLFQKASFMIYQLERLYKHINFRVSIMVYWIKIYCMVYMLFFCFKWRFYKIHWRSCGWQIKKIWQNGAFSCLVLGPVLTVLGPEFKWNGYQFAYVNVEVWLERKTQYAYHLNSTFH